ncbi:class I SAM-dependent methyltransferase [Streptomyces sp. NPDC004111]|uniref:class I SAM-dependent methyltransferase n=1 Tax=Streptomyces sp. NPDC004111 TaxID=3364690 RepID=UPI0036BEA23C
MTTVSESAAFWENQYSRNVSPQWGTKPNTVLARLVTDLDPAPGTALDLGCGHGGDALWLAGLGWEVTAVDVSGTALGRVAASAAAAGVGDRVHPCRHDLAESFPDGTFDLVTASYFHTPVEIPRDRVLRAAARAVAPGGLLILVEHASTAPWSWKPDDGTELTFPTPREVLDSLQLDTDTPGGGWHVEQCHAPARTATGPEGQRAQVTENVLVLRRTA